MMAQKYRKFDPRTWDDEQFDNLSAVLGETNDNLVGVITSVI